MAMTDYQRDNEIDNSNLWTKEAPPVALSGVFRFRRWLFPALTATVILVLIIILGVTNAKSSNRLRSVEQRATNLSNVIQSLNASLQQAQETAKEVNLLQVVVANNKDELTSVGEALKQLSVVDALGRSVAQLKCSLERIINNSSAKEGCCPLGWVAFGSSCYHFSSVTLSWMDSSVWCAKHGAHLVIIPNDKTWDFVIKHTVPELFWVGLTDWRTGQWEWVNQTPYTMERRRWAPGQPDSWTGHGVDNKDEDCAHLHRDGRLNDVHCTTRMRFVCQKHSMHT